MRIPLPYTYYFSELFIQLQKTIAKKQLQKKIRNAGFS